METIVKVTSAEYVTHDVRQFRLEKPPGFTFSPGQATELSINKEGVEGQKESLYVYMPHGCALPRVYY